MLTQEQQILQEISRIQLSLQEISIANADKQNCQAKQEAEIEYLQNQISSILLPDLPNLSHLQDQITELNALIGSLDNQLLNETNTTQEFVRKNQVEIAQLQLKNTELTNISKKGSVLDKTQLERSHALVDELKRQNDIKFRQNVSHLAKVEKTKFQLLKDDQQLRNLNRQIQELRILQEQQNLKLQEVQKEKIEYEQLLKDYSALEKELQQVTQGLAHEKEQRQTAKSQLRKVIHNQAKAKDELKKIQDAEIQVEKSLKSQLADLEKANHERSAEKDRAVASLEREVGSREAQVDGLRKLASTKREEVRKEDERIAEEQRKMQKAKNYKDLTRAAYIEHEGLVRAKDNQLNIYNNTVQNKSTYATRQTLEILQRELSRHQIQKGGSVDGRAKELEKLQKTNTHLKDKIKKLTRLSQESEAKEQKYLNELSKKQDALLLERLGTDKLITEKTNKLNEFIKHFPNHDQDKEQKKKMHIKKTQSFTIDQPQKPHIPKKRKGKAEKQAEEELLQLKEMGLKESEGSQLFQETSWYKRRTFLDYELPEDQPLYKNHYFQGAAVLLVLLLVTVLNLD